MSKKAENRNEQLQKRLDEFWKAHATYDSPWARNTLHHLNEMLPYIFEKVGGGVTALYKDSGVKLADHDLDWMEAPEHGSAQELKNLPIFKLALELRAYAYYGLKLGLLNTHYHNLESFLDEVAADLRQLPPNWGQDEETEKTIKAASARAKIDHSVSGGLTFEELGALAGVSRKSILNLLGRGSRAALQRNLDGLITVESAKRWLLARPDFRPSLWQEQKGTSTQHSEPSLIGEPLFVPVAADGSWFSPTNCLRRDDQDDQDPHYYVANGDNEESYEDYWEALNFLARAASPRWRYTDATDRWRIKIASSWERKAREEVAALLPSKRQTEKNSGARNERE
jgi:hypothetical protein